MQNIWPVYLVSLLISVTALYSETPATGEWLFRTEKLSDGNYVYRPVTLQAGPVAADCAAGFTYNDTLSNGPSNWGSICVQWAACSGNGGRQSPIDIVTANSVRKPTGTLQESYNATFQTSIINEDENLNLYGVLDDKTNYISGGPLDDNYQLISFHYHIPSEHTLDGVRYPLELHLVHQSMNKATPTLAVVGLLFEQSIEFNSTSLGQFIAGIQGFGPSVVSTIQQGPNPNVSHVSTSAILTLHQEIFPTAKEKTFFTYPGSLTTPPCAEIVTWLVMETPLFAGSGQIAFLASLIGSPKGNNARPVQPLGPRTVSHFSVTTTTSAKVPPGGVAGIVLLLIFVFVGAIAWCSLSLSKNNQVLFCNKMTDYEFLGYFQCPPVRKRPAGSINSGPASDDADEEEEEEEGIKEQVKGKGKGRDVGHKSKGGDDDDEEEEQLKPQGKPKKQVVEDLDEDDEEEQRPRPTKKPSQKKSGGYGTTANDDEDFDAPAPKKSTRGH